MKRSYLGVFAFSLLLGGMSVAGEMPASSTDQVSSIIQEFQTAKTEFMEAYKAASEEEKKKLYPAKYPKAEPYATRLMQIAVENPNAPSIANALSWIVSECEQGREKNAAMKMLVEDYIDTDALGDVCERMMYARDKEAESTLAKILESTSNRSVKGKACFSLAYVKKNLGDSAAAEKLFERVVAQYGDIASHRGTLGKSAEGALFEVRNLAMGMDCPEISGEDIDGVAFNLSDYRGKVVFLDYWGHW